MSNYISELGNAISNTMRKRIADEARAKRGTIDNGWFYSKDGKSYPIKIAVDCNANNGAKVWAQLTPDGKAVIIGA